MDDKEVYERLTKVEERAKSNTHQLDELKPIVSEIHNLSKTMVELITMVKNTNANVQDLKMKVTAFEKAPSERLTQIKTAIIAALVTSGVGAVVVAIIGIL